MSYEESAPWATTALPRITPIEEMTSKQLENLAQKKLLWKQLERVGLEEGEEFFADEPTVVNTPLPNLKSVR